MNSCMPAICKAGMLCHWRLAGRPQPCCILHALFALCTVGSNPTEPILAVPDSFTFALDNTGSLAPTKLDVLANDFGTGIRVVRFQPSSAAQQGTLQAEGKGFVYSVEQYR